MTTRVITPLYIFDLDGTLALIEHRRHFVERPRVEQDWGSFYKACVDDVPNYPVIYTLRTLYEAGCDIWIFSGRSDEVRAETENWLYRYVLKDLHIEMRRQGDYTPDDKLKLGWYHRMLDYDRERLVAVFEDRQRMVEMWRSMGVPCFQVAPGNF